MKKRRRDNITVTIAFDDKYLYFMYGNKNMFMFKGNKDSQLFGGFFLKKKVNYCRRQIDK